MIVVQALGYDWRAGIVLGGALAMSSTAIVSKMLAERAELSTPHGRDVMFDKAASGAVAPSAMDAPKDPSKPSAQTGAAVAGGTK